MHFGHISYDNAMCLYRVYTVKFFMEKYTCSDVISLISEHLSHQAQNL